jgi:hypothetical protein
MFLFFVAHSSVGETSTPCSNLFLNRFIYGQF